MLRGMRDVLSAILLVVIAGCGGSRATPQPSAVASTPSVAPSAAPPGVSAAAPSAPPPLATADTDASAPSPPAAPAPRPAPVERTGKTWPFHTWDRAVAVTFNQFPMRADAQLRAYDEKGWSPHIVDRKTLTDATAKKSLEIVTAHGGDVAVSKCPFPRHAVVLYDGDVPVASINVCFQCGDVMLWPRWSSAPEPDWNKMTSKQVEAHHAREAKRVDRYEATFLPRWKAYFRDDVGFAIDAVYH